MFNEKNVIIFKEFKALLCGNEEEFANVLIVYMKLQLTLRCFTNVSF